MPSIDPLSLSHPEASNLAVHPNPSHPEPVVLQPTRKSDHLSPLQTKSRVASAEIDITKVRGPNDLLRHNILTKNQYDAFVNYTTSGWELNDALRAVGPLTLQDTTTVENLTAALAVLRDKGWRLSAISHRIIRKVAAEQVVSAILAAEKENRAFIDPAVISTTLSPFTIRQLISDHPWDYHKKDPLLHYRGDAGLSISRIAIHPAERELLYAPATPFIPLITGYEGEKKWDRRKKCPIDNEYKGRFHAFLEEKGTPPHVGTQGYFDALTLCKNTEKKEMP